MIICIDRLGNCGLLNYYDHFDRRYTSYIGYVLHSNIYTSCCTDVPRKTLLFDAYPLDIIRFGAYWKRFEVLLIDACF